MLLAALRDAWLEWRRFPEAVVRVGQFIEPCSAEDISSSRYLEFAERSALNRLTLGQALTSDQGRPVSDDNDEKELAVLVYLRPLPNVRLGAGGTWADVDDVAASRFDPSTTEHSILHLDATAGSFDGASPSTRRENGCWAA